NDDQSIHIEKRRVCHINAEQKRRGNIKNGFETVKSLLPESDFDSTTKISKALMLQKAADYIQKLEREKCDQQKEFEKLRREIDELNEKITLLQNTLPINGCSMDQKDYQSQTQTLTNLRKRYADYVSEKINENWKFHLVRNNRL
ncbi:Carbohydrate-responsive element-binding protein, partial [Sarcoptes scabiei]